MSKYFSIFGFDALKSAYRKKTQTEDKQPRTNKRATAKVGSDEDRIADSEHPEIILWGMYPIY